VPLLRPTVGIVGGRSTLSYTEFCKAMASLGISLTSEVEELWKSLDADGSGEIVYHELKAALTPHATPAKPSAQAMDPNNQRHDWHYSRQDWEQAAGLIERPSGIRDTPYAQQVGVHRADMDRYMMEHGRDTTVAKHVPKEHARGKLHGMGKIDADASDGAAVRKQLRSAIGHMASARVIDVLRAWDTDGNGSISMREFAGAMAALGLSASATEMKELFAEFDPDHSGAIDYHELKEALTGRPASRR
jgi:Ca2+-binding EF-hand superfamily protein